MNRARLAVEAVSALLVLIGVLAYVLVDPYGTLGNPPECDDNASCRMPWWNDGGAVQGLLVVLGIAGLGVLLASLLSRALSKRGER